MGGGRVTKGRSEKEGTWGSGMLGVLYMSDRLR